MNVRLTGLALFALFAGGLSASEVMPGAPSAHFNDYASLVSASTASTLDLQLTDFERSTSNQFLVVIYPKLESDSSLEDYTVRVAQSWHAGLKGKDNGVVLFIFAQSHQIYLQVGYGLEGALPDALAQRIITDEIVPRFKSGDYDGGVIAGVNAVMAATKGEYHGSGRTVAQGKKSGFVVPVFFWILLVFIILSFIRR